MYKHDLGQAVILHPGDVPAQRLQHQGLCSLDIVRLFDDFIVGFCKRRSADCRVQTID